MNNNLREFNLEEAVKGAPLVTRDGRKVTEFKYFETHVTGNCIAVIDGLMYDYDMNGKAIGNAISFDLFLAPRIIERWQNVYLYPESSNRPFSRHYNSKKTADEFASSIRTHYLKTYWSEEGVI